MSAGNVLDAPDLAPATVNIDIKSPRSQEGNLGNRSMCHVIVNVLARTKCEFADKSEGVGNVAAQTNALYQSVLRLNSVLSTKLPSGRRDCSRWLLKHRKTIYSPPSE